LESGPYRHFDQLAIEAAMHVDNLLHRDVECL
jgi:hypothetical protein